MTFRLGLRLAVAGGQESLLRLAVTAFGVAVGVVLLLLCLTGQSAEQGRAERSGWQSADTATPATAPDPALFLTVTDYHEGTAMIRGYVAALGPRPPVPPGLERLPGRARSRSPRRCAGSSCPRPTTSSTTAIPAASLRPSATRGSPIPTSSSRSSDARRTSSAR